MVSNSVEESAGSIFVKNWNRIDMDPDVSFLVRRLSRMRQRKQRALDPRGPAAIHHDGNVHIGICTASPFGPAAENGHLQWQLLQTPKPEAKPPQHVLLRWRQESVFSELDCGRDRIRGPRFPQAPFAQPSPIGAHALDRAQSGSCGRSSSTAFRSLAHD
jgi:hypothetical protein